MIGVGTRIHAPFSPWRPITDAYRAAGPCSDATRLGGRRREVLPRRDRELPNNHKNPDRCRNQLGYVGT